MISRKIFVATLTFAENSNQPIEILEKSGFTIRLNDTGKKLNTMTQIKALYDVGGIIAGTEAYSKEILSQLPKLKVISRLGVGMDNIDLEAAKEKGIKVFKTETTPAPAVVELVLGLLIDLARKISHTNRSLKAGQWKKQMGNLLYGKTLGIIGLGTIGKSLVQIAKGINFKILAFDSNHDNRFADKHGIRYCDLDTLLSEADLLSVHLNLS